jgi:purine-binding chemotaxis protein CheW
MNYATFTVGDHHFAVDVQYVTEVIRALPTAPVPRSTESIQGLVNIRGQIAVSVNLSHLLGLNRVDDRAALSVVIHHGAAHLSLIVDRVGDVLSHPETDLLEPPSRMGHRLKELVNAIIKLDTNILLVLDVPALVERVAAVERGQVAQNGA